MEDLRNSQGISYSQIYRNGQMPDMIDVCNKITELIRELNALQSNISGVDSRIVKVEQLLIGHVKNFEDRIAHLEEKEKLLANLRK